MIKPRRTTIRLVFAWKLISIWGLLFAGATLSGQPAPPPVRKQSATKEKTPDQPNWLESATRDRLDGRKPLFYLSPGVSNITVDLDFSERNRPETSLTEPIATSFALDIAFPEIQIGEKFGAGFILHTTTFRLKRQHVRPGDENVLHDTLISLSEGEEAVRDSDRDLGSRVRGYSTMAVPFLFYGKPGPGNYRLGAGVGIGRTEFNGTIVNDDQPSRFLLIDSLQNPSRVKGMSRYHLFTSSLLDVRTLDPISLHLFWNIDRRGKLETLGLYWLATERVAPRAADFAYMRFFNGDLNEPELLALRGFSNGLISMRQPLAPAFMLFAETPGFLGGFKFRLAVEGLFFDRGRYTVDLNITSLALYYPIPVSLPGG